MEIISNANQCFFGCLPLLGKTGWSTIVVNWTRQIPNENFDRDALVPFLRLYFSRKIESKTKGLEKAWN